MMKAESKTGKWDSRSSSFHYCAAPSTKIRISSWLLAAGYLAFGLVFFKAISDAGIVFQNTPGSLPPDTKTVLDLGPYFWLGLGIAGAVAVVLKDVGIESRVGVNVAFAVVLVLLYWVVLMAVSGKPLLAADSRRSEPTQTDALKLASRLAVGMKEEEAVKLMTGSGLTQRFVKVGGAFRWTEPFELANGCVLVLDFKPKYFDPTNLLRNGILQSACIQSNGVNVAAIPLKNGR